MGGLDNDEIEKYGGGTIGHLTWLRIMQDCVFNEPIFEALWKNDPNDIEALSKPPKWYADYDIAKKSDEWKLALDFGMKYFPLKFGSTDKSKQKSMLRQSAANG